MEFEVVKEVKEVEEAQERFGRMGFGIWRQAVERC